MRDHFDHFVNFMVGASGDLMSREEFDAYCDKIANTSEWGGQMEIVSFAKAFNCNVQIVSANEADVEVCENAKEEKKLVVTYHKYQYGSGAHYNSVQMV